MPTTYFIDFNRGNDSNAGTDPNAPWKTLFKMDDAAKGPGDMILLADDSRWDIGGRVSTRVNPGTNWTGTREAPVTIGKYSPSSQSVGQYPVITNYFIAERADWTYSAPNNAWVLASPNTYAWQRSALCQINRQWAEIYNLGDLVLPSDDYAFNVDNANFYLYAPASTNPVDYYGEILLSSGGGVFHLQAGRNWITLQDLFFELTNSGILVNTNGTGTQGVVMRNIRGEQVSAAIRTNTSGAAAGGFAEIDIGHCNFKQYAMCAIYLVGGQGIARCDVHHNRIVDGTFTNGQGAIYSTLAPENGRGRIFDNRIGQVRFGTRYQTQDGCGIYTDIGSDKMDVFRNLVWDAYLPANDNGGEETRWWSNVFLNVYSGFRLGDGQAAAGTPNTDHTFFNNTVITTPEAERWKSQYSNGLPLCGWRCSETTNTIPSVVLRNNLLLNVGGASSFAGILAPVNVTSQTYENNAVSGYASVATINMNPWTAVSTDDTITGDPMVNALGVPLPGSPLLTDGLDLGPLRDIRGIQGRGFIGAHAPAQFRRRLA